MILACQPTIPLREPETNRFGSLSKPRGNTRRVVVHGDDFSPIMEPDTRAALTPAQGVQLYYHWQRLRDQVLVPLKSGREGRYRPYDWTANALAADEVRFRAASVVVVEGLIVSRPESADLIDVTLLLATDAAARERRQLERADASSEWLMRWDAAERWCLGNVRPPASFDVTITGVG